MFRETNTQKYEEITLRHHKTKLLKISEKETIFKAVREKEIIHTQGEIITQNISFRECQPEENEETFSKN